MIFKTELKLFEGVELVLHAMSCAAVKVSVESVVDMKLTLTKILMKKMQCMK